MGLIKVRRTVVYEDWLGNRIVTRHIHGGRRAAIYIPRGAAWGPLRMFRKDRGWVANRLWVRRKSWRKLMEFTG